MKASAFFEKLRRSNLVRKSAPVMLIRLGNIGVSLLLGVILARTLGASGFGRYSYVYSILLMLAIPAQLGLAQLIMRETAKANANANESWGLIRGLLRWSNIAICIFSIIIVAVIILYSNYGNMSEQKLFLIGALLIPLGALGNIRGATLVGLGRAAQGQFPEMVFRPLLFASLTFILWLFMRPNLLTPETAMVLHVLSSGVAFIFGTIVLFKFLPNELTSRPQSIYRSKAWFLSAFPLGMIAGIQVINTNLDIVMLGIYRPPEEVGVYKVVVMAATLVSFGMQAVNLVIMPRVVRLYEKGDIHALQALVTSSARLIMSLAIAVALVLTFFGSWILHSAFGANYAEGYTILMVLVVAQLINSAFGSVVLLLNMSGNEKETMTGVAVASCVNVALNFLLIPLYGSLGAAVATSATLVAWSAILCWRVNARMRINSSIIRFRN